MQKRRRPPRWAGRERLQKWKPKKTQTCSARHKRGEAVKAMAAALDRQESGVRARLVKLGLILK